MADAEREVDDVLSGNVLSVQELNDRIASVVQDTPALNGVRCIGEVTDLHQNSTALYFTLNDGDSELPVCSGRTAIGTWTSNSRTGPRSSSKAISTTGQRAGKSTSSRGR
ncbi:exodeoxyribonuclease VII large subunit [Halospeciosus flavus]|uniref:exodeoxyribonuclease VII large subunit n=1 Tax=Halospeciosus flavus TaxID=3032283 RepID=UPI00360818E1